MHAPIQGFNPRRQCPICRSADINDHHVFDGIRTATCAACGFMFTRDIKAASAIDQLYVDGYHDRRHMDGQRVNATVNVDLLRRFVPELSGRSVLDIGSGYGFLLHALRDSGAKRLVGVELSQAQRRHATETLGVETRAHLDDIGEDERFDVVTLFEVIEHIPEPCEFIAQACKHLAVGGSLIVGTDNFDSDVVHQLGDKFPKWIPHEHVSLFTPNSLQGLVTRVGGLAMAGTRSYTSWELLLRAWLYRTTAGGRGGKDYSYEAETSPHDGQAFRYFMLRLMANKLWFKLAARRDLEGEMMYVHAIKSAPQ